MSEKYAKDLSVSRAGSSLQNTKKNIDAAKDVASLMTYFDPMMDWLFGLSLASAILKDILDILNTALIAVGGLGAILIFISTAMASSVITVTMFLTGSSGKSKTSQKIITRILLLVGATVVEFVPGVDVAPVETALVIVVVWMTLVERKVSAEKEKEDAKQKQTRKPNPNSKYTTTTAHQTA